MSATPPHTDCPHAETIATLGKRFDGLSSKVDGLSHDLKDNCIDTKKVLTLLQGPDPLSKPEEGMVAKVNRHEETHKTVKKALFAAVISALSAIGSLIHFSNK